MQVYKAIDRDHSVKLDEVFKFSALKTKVEIDSHGRVVEVKFLDVLDGVIAVVQAPEGMMFLSPVKEMNGNSVLPPLSPNL
jgi:hypothetical protein